MPSSPGDAAEADVLLVPGQEVLGRFRWMLLPLGLLGFRTDLGEGGGGIESVCGAEVHGASKLQDGTCGVSVIRVWPLGAERRTPRMVSCSSLTRLSGGA